MTIENTLEAPKRQIDVSSLSAGLAAQAIARETDRISTMEADIRERAFFNRRLKGERFLDRRRQEIEDWQVEQQRLKGQAERLHDLEEAEKAAEKEAAKKAAADNAGAEKGESVKPAAPEGGPATAAKRPVRVRSGPEERRSGRECAAPSPDPPAEAQDAPDASRPDAGQALLIVRNGAAGRRTGAGQSGALRLEHEHPDGR